MKPFRVIKQGTRHWQCSRCGRIDEWGPGWMWYGSWKEYEETGKVQEVRCPACPPAADAEDDRGSW